MRIGIIGAGFVARAVATVALRHGHEVMLSNSRGPGTLFSVVGIGCRAGTPEQAAEFGEIVLVAIPLKAYPAVPVAELAGKIVLDANNYYPQRDENIEALDRDEVSTSELLAGHLPGSRVVKVFNTIQARDIETDGKPSGSEHRRALPIAGDDPAAKKMVADLLDQFGFDTVDAGPLTEGRRFQKDTPAYCVLFDTTGLRRARSMAR